MTRALERVAAVMAGGGQGTGVLLSNRLLLTASHVVGDEHYALAAVPGGRRVQCAVFGHVGDVALLGADSPLSAELPPLKVALLRDPLPLPDCHAAGFPDVERDDARHLSGHLFTGTLKPVPGRIRGHCILESVHRPPNPAAPGASPWAGLSGSGVFHRDVLLGIVISDHRPDRWGHSQLAVQTLGDLMDSAELGPTVNSAVKRVDPPTFDENERFEAHYRESLRSLHGTIRIFGLDLDHRVQDDINRMELDAAYLSLGAERSWDAQDGTEHGAARATGTIESLLADRPRVLLRGHAGSGKTTLVQWLALHCNEVPGFEARVPFVLKLRSLRELPFPGTFLAASRHPLAPSEPSGWTDTVLRTGRGLLLIDGVDEIPEAERGEGRQWISGLLRLYPETAVVVTARPTAVPPDWLVRDGFEELSLLPMTGEHRKTFVDRWHQASGGLTELRDSLLRALSTSPTLNALTDSPLLCAMICALHRNRSGSLPSDRMEVYDAALNMLLARRDEERKVALPLLGKRDHLALLQALAHWLVKEGLAEGDRADAVNQIARTQQCLGSEVRARSATELYRYALERSGLLVEPSEDAFVFIHRTFQDYLAAKEFAEDRAFNSLLSHADDEQWADVIRMTVSHCAPSDRALLLSRLVQDESPEDHVLLAASCLPYAARLDPDVRSRVLGRLEPLAHTDRLPELACVGDDVLPLLPPTVWTERPEATAELLARLGSRAALRALAAGIDPCRAAGSLPCLSDKWAYFDTTEFVDVLLRDLAPHELVLQVTQPAQLVALDTLGPVGAVTYAALPAGALLSHRPHEDTPRVYVLDTPDLQDLEILRGHTSVERLSLVRCPHLRDLRRIPELRPAAVSLWDLPSVPTDHLSEVAAALEGCPEFSLGPAELTRLAGRVTVDGVQSTVLNARGEAGEQRWLRDVLQVFPTLRSLRLSIADTVSSFDLRALAGTDVTVHVLVSRRRTVMPELHGRQELKRLTVHQPNAS